MKPDQYDPEQQGPNLQHPEKPLNNLPVPNVMPQAPDISSSLPPVPPAEQPNVEPTPATTATGYAHPIADKPRRTYNPKRFKLLLIVIVAISILSVGAAVALTLLPFMQKQTATVPETSKPVAPEKPVSAKTAIDHVKDYFKGEQLAKTPISLPVMATGSDFYTVVPDVAPLVSVAGEVAPDASERQLSSIIHSLEGDKFVQRVSSNGANQTAFLADFTRKETFCEVSVQKPTDVKQNHLFEVRCLDMATYVDYAAAQKPLVSQYSPLSATSVQYGFVGKPASLPSKTANYALVDMEVSIVVDNRMTSTGKYAQFYQSPDGLWYYFRDRDTAAVIDCDKYNSDEVRKAYFGVSCRNSTKGDITTVQAPRGQ